MFILSTDLQSGKRKTANLNLMMSKLNMSLKKEPITTSVTFAMNAAIISARSEFK